MDSQSDDVLISDRISILREVEIFSETSDNVLMEIASFLKEMKVKHIIVKAPNEDHKHVLEKVGATEVIIPEREMADKVAKSLISPNVLDYIPLSDEYTICEIVPPPSFMGKSIAELHLRSKHHVSFKFHGSSRI